MEKVKKKEAFKRAIAAFGEWRSWGRAEHLAYGLIRGVPYAVMEKCANDDSHAFLGMWGHCSSIRAALHKLGAWPEYAAAQYISLPKECLDEVKVLVVWTKKVPRGKRMRPSNRAEVSAP